MPENGLSYLILKIVVTTEHTGPADRHCWNLHARYRLPSPKTAKMPIEAVDL